MQFVAGSWMLHTNREQQMPQVIRTAHGKVPRHDRRAAAKLSRGLLQRRDGAGAPHPRRVPEVASSATDLPAARGSEAAPWSSCIQTTRELESKGGAQGGEAGCAHRAAR